MLNVMEKGMLTTINHLGLGTWKKPTWQYQFGSDGKTKQSGTREGCRNQNENENENENEGMSILYSTSAVIETVTPLLALTSSCVHLNPFEAITSSLPPSSQLPRHLLHFQILASADDGDVWRNSVGKLQWISQCLTILHLVGCHGMMTSFLSHS
jgi:hypothetical protein